jgi:hypothetical protein
MCVPGFGTSSNQRVSDESRNRRTQYEGPLFEWPNGKHRRRSRSIAVRDMPQSRDKQTNHAFSSEL